MLNKYLSALWHQNSLSSSWIINSAEVSNVLQELEQFLQAHILIGDLDLARHPDYYLVKRQEGLRDVSIDQIRDLQKFMYKTPAIGNSKAAVIYEADLMNLNAANSMLKILEDTPASSYIFLITSKGATLLPTIRSRCAKYTINLVNTLNSDERYEQFLDLLITNDIINTLEIIKKLKNKDKELWKHLISHSLTLISKVTKKLNAVEIYLNDKEKGYSNIVADSDLIEKFNNISQLNSDTLKYDLDLAASFIILLEELKHNGESSF